MHATPSDLEALVKSMERPGKNTAYSGFYGAALRICETLETALVIVDDEERASWLVDVEAIRIWAAGTLGTSGAMRLKTLKRILQTAQRSWRGPSKGAVRTLPFVKDVSLRAIAERDLHSMNSAVLAEETKSALILGGSVVEAVLLDVLERDPALTQQAVANLQPAKHFSGQPKDWRFESLIEASGPTGLAALSKTTVTLSHTVRQWRNFVHPDRERNELRTNPLRFSDAQVASALTQKTLEEAEQWCLAHP